MANRIYSIIRKSWDGLKRHPVLVFFGSLGFAGAFDTYDRVKSVTETGSALMTDWLGPAWLSITVASPYFKVGCLVAALCCFWRIGVLAVREERAVEGRQKEWIAGALKEISTDFAGLDRLRRAERARLNIPPLEEKIARIEWLLNNFENQKQITIGDNSAREWLDSNNEAYRRAEILLNVLPAHGIPAPSQPNVAWNLVPSNQGTALYTMSVDQNADFIAATRKKISDLRPLVSTVGSRISQIEREYFKDA